MVGLGIFAFSRRNTKVLARNNTRISLSQQDPGRCWCKLAAAGRICKEKYGMLEIPWELSLPYYLLLCSYSPAKFILVIISTVLDGTECSSIAFVFSNGRIRAEFLLKEFWFACADYNDYKLLSREIPYGCMCTRIAVVILKVASVSCSVCGFWIWM